MSLHYDRELLAGRLLLELETDSASSERLMAKLSNLVHVLDVRSPRHAADSSLPAGTPAGTVLPLGLGHR